MILKKKIEQLLNGKFEYEQPQLLFSKEKLTLTMKAGETKRGEVYVGTQICANSRTKYVRHADHVPECTQRTV